MSADMDVIREFAERFFEERCWAAARRATVDAGENWVLGDADPNMLTDDERVVLYTWVRSVRGGTAQTGLGRIASALGEPMARDRVTLLALWNAAHEASR